MAVLSDSSTGEAGRYARRRRGARTVAALALTLLSLALVSSTARPPATARAQAACPCSIWGATAAPEEDAHTDSDPVEVGVKFRADVDGYVTAIRFYKGEGNTGTHVGSLWSGAGKLLGSTVFTDETASGWQQATLPAPVRVFANTTYVASYHAPAGGYAISRGLLNTDVVNGPLRALASGTDGDNGVFKYGAGAFPTESYQATNYWVDVVFDTSAADSIPPPVTRRSPAAGATDVASDAKVSATFGEDVDGSTISFTLRGPGDAAIDAAAGYDPETHTATLQPRGALVAGATYTATVSGAADTAGNRMAAPVTWSFTTASAPPPAPAGPSQPETSAAAAPQPAPLNVSVTLDRGSGGVYYTSEEMTVCVTVTRAATVRVTTNLARPEGSLIYGGPLEGRRCFVEALVGQSTGPKSVRAVALENGEEVASAGVDLNLANAE